MKYNLGRKEEIVMNKLECIIQVIDYIENHLNEKLTLSSIAVEIGYSKYHLHRMFTDVVGITIHDYVQRRQLSEAAELLVFSKKSILEISLIAGYESQQAFTTIFKQMYKKTPNEYRTNKEFYPLQLRFSLNEKLYRPLLDNIKTKIILAKLSDIPLWLDLVNLIIDGFPNLKEKEYLEILKKAIIEKQALILKDRGFAIAVMIICFETNSIDFFGVHPLYRKLGIEKLFLDKLMNEILIDKEISITTFREGDKADPGYRKVYKELGFAQAELLIEFGYPTQKFILSPQSKGDINE